MMLYGFDDDEEDEALHYDNSYGGFQSNNKALIKVDQVNVKMIVITSLIVLGVLLIVLFGFSFFKNRSDSKVAGEEITLASNDKKVSNYENIDDKDKKDDVINEESNIDDTIYDPNKISENGIIITDKQIEESIDQDTKILATGHLRIPRHNIKDYVFVRLPVENPTASKEIKDIYYQDTKQVYLTFDDGPTKEITPKILDILKEYDVPATFFVLGFRVDLNPDILKREFNEGHYIANHGYSHKYSKIYETKDTVFQEFVETENSIKNALENQDYNSYLFRFPGGSTGGKHSKVKQEARELLNTYNIAFTNWNCLSGDAEGKTTKEACVNEIIKTREDNNSLIVLMHDAADKTQTVEALPEIIQYFKDEGFEFKNFYDVFCEKE